eukprot:GSA25T00020755001.1
MTPRLFLAVVQLLLASTKTSAPSCGHAYKTMSIESTTSGVHMLCECSGWNRVFHKKDPHKEVGDLWWTLEVLPQQEWELRENVSMGELYDLAVRLDIDHQHVVTDESRTPSSTSGSTPGSPSTGGQSSGTHSGTAFLLPRERERADGGTIR